MSEGLWKAADVARFLGVSRRTVPSLAGLPAVELPSVKGTRPIIRYRPEDVRAWASNRTTRMSGEAA